MPPSRSTPRIQRCCRSKIHFQSCWSRMFTRESSTVGSETPLSPFEKDIGSYADVKRSRESWRSASFARKMEGTPYKPLSTPDLPSSRVSDDPPFTHTGLDFAGPLYVSSHQGTSKDELTNKAYVCLFTCASTRAIHLELTPDLQVKSFLQAFRRFASSYTDIRQRQDLQISILWNTEDCPFTRSLTLPGKHPDNLDIHHRESSLVGFFWERLIRSVKTSLKKIVGRTSLDHYELSTVLPEVECVINARPLTYVYDESISYPLTPSHLINGRRVTAMPNSEHFEVISTYQTLTRRQHHHRNLLQQFARQWKHEYLLNLRENAVVKSTKEGSELICRWHRRPERRLKIQRFLENCQGGGACARKGRESKGGCRESSKQWQEASTTEKSDAAFNTDWSPSLEISSKHFERSEDTAIFWRLTLPTRGVSTTFCCSLDATEMTFCYFLFRFVNIIHRAFRHVIRQHCNDCSATLWLR